MKTLKKTLCLVLAVVMAVGVLILPANAAGYKDLSDTTEINENYAVAVETLTNLGIISGKASGDTTKFDPNGTLLRQEAAIMIVNVMMTADEKKTELAGYKDEFTDIAGVDVYARKEINYLAAKGIVSGKDTEAKLFKPHDTLTTYELLTMLRKVAEVKNGYVPGEGEWTVEAMKFATAYGAFNAEDLKSLFDEPNKTPTREEAAQIIFSVITTETKSSATGTYTVTIKQGTTIKNVYPGVSLEQAMMLSLTYQQQDGFTVTVEPDGVGGTTIGKKVYGLTLTRLQDPYGRPFNAWTNGKGGKDTVVFSEIEIPAMADYTDKEVTFLKLFVTDLKVGYDANNQFKVHIYKDGVSVGTDGTPKDDAEVFIKDSYNLNPTATAPNAKRETVSGYGVDTKVYKIDTNEYVIVQIQTHVAVLGKAATDGKIYIDGASTTTDAKDDITVDSANYSEGDVVLYTTGKYTYGPKVGYVASEVQLASTVSGYISHKSAANSTEKYIRINAEATKYHIAEEIEEDLAWNAVTVAPATSEPIDFYVDARNNLYLIDDPNSNVDLYASPNYIYVVASDTVAATSGLYGVSTAAGARIEYVNLATGKLEVADLAVVKSGNNWYLADKDGNPTRVQINTAHQELNLKGFRSYVTTSKGWVLNDVDEDVDPTSNATDKLILAKGSSVVTIDRATDFVKYANGNTTLVLLKHDTTTDTYSATTYNGYKNFVDVNAGTNKDQGFKVDQALVVTNRNPKSNTLVTAIYAIYETVSGTSDSVYGLYVSEGETSAAGTTHYFIVDGELVSYLRPAVESTALGATWPNVYSLTFDGNGNLTTAREVNDSTRKHTASSFLSIDGQTFIINGSEYKLADDVVIYNITKTDDPKFETKMPTIDLDKVKVTFYTLDSTPGNGNVISLVVISAK